MGESKDEEIELDLGLSIGGSFRNAENSSNKMENLNESGLMPNGFDLDERKSWQVLENGDHQLQESAEFMDLQNKREIDQALRRREAKRKREQRRAPNCCNDRSMERVAESEIDESVCKKERVDRDDATNTYVKNVNLNLVSAESVNDNGGSNLRAYSSSAVTTAPPPYVVSPQAAGLAYGYGMVQYGPFNNGFGFPCAVPCQGTIREEMKNVVQVQPAMACRGFRPFQNGSESGERDPGRHRKAKSNGSSSMCSSPMVSDYLSSSHEGGGSSDGRSHSANSLTQPTHQLNNKKENKLKSQPEPSISSSSMKPDYGNIDGSIDGGKESQLHNLQPSATTTKEETTAANNAGPNDNENPPPCPLKKTKSDMGKPPKPQSETPALPQMPYVSTTGNGPNGKTVTGFLYRYTKSEVSIVCVCHGSTFSPAEFVQHAGGTDISHPLRHITVIPSAFG